jgi:hypothetical protein
MVEEKRVKVGDYVAIVRYPSGRSAILGYGQTVDQARGLMDADVLNHIATTLRYNLGRCPEWYVAEVSSVHRAEIPPSHREEA